MAENPLLGIFLAAVLTAVLQSSSATTAIIISLSIQGLIGLDAAIPFIMGTNIGTCFTALLAGIGSSITGKRVALGNLLFNVSGVAIFYLFLNPFIILSSLTSSTIPRQIANAHTLFNVINTFILLPFSQKAEKDLKYIFSKVEKSLRHALKALQDHNIEMAKMVAKREDDIDRVEESFRNEHIERLKKHICNPESGIVYLDILSNLERIGDHAYDISLAVIDELTNHKE